jgi:putative transcriptional regulator
MSDSIRRFEGQALLASPFMEDPQFWRAVVYIVRHTADDAFGLVVNHPTSVTVQHVLKSVADEDVECGLPLFRGGPVEGPLILIHDQEHASDFSTSPGIHLSSERDHIHEVIRKEGAKFRLFDGFAGWGAGQLDEEIATGSWILSEITHDEIFASPDGLWKELIHRVGNDVLSQMNLRVGEPKRAEWN